MCPVPTITAVVKKFTFFIIISKEVALSVNLFVCLFVLQPAYKHRSLPVSLKISSIFSVLVLVKLQLMYERDYFGSSFSCTVCTIRDILQLGC